MRPFMMFSAMMGGIAGAGIAGFLGKLLIVTGILTLVLLAMPWLILVGLFLLIIPGVILMLIPNIFLWASVFALAFYPLRALVGEVPAAIVAAVFAAAALYLIPSAAAVEGDRRFAALKRPDVVPADPVRLEGEILIVQPQAMSHRSLMTGKSTRDDPGQMCNSLCTAILFTDKVTSVSVVDDKNSPVTFRLKSRGQCMVPIALPSPGPLDAALGVDWAARIERGLCIDREEGATARPDIRIDITVDRDRQSGKKWRFGPFGGEVQRLEVRRGDELVLRKSGIEYVRIARPLHIIGDGGLENFKLGWGRKTLKDGARTWDFSVHKLLDEHSSLRTGVTREESRNQARDFIEEALAQPASPLSDAVAGMVPTYFASFSPFGRPRGKVDVTDRDIDLFKGMLEDPRFTNFDRSHDLASSAGDRIVELRDPLVARLLEFPYNPDDRSNLYGLDPIFRSQPAGAFATLTRGEETLLADRERRGILGGLIVRLSDQGSTAVPRLVAMLRDSQQAIKDHRAQRKSGPAPHWAQSTASAAKNALRRLGREGAAALPEIERMVAEGLFGQYDTEHQSFHMLLARLGKPIEQIPKPENMGGTEEKFHDHLRERLAKYDPERDH